MLFVAIDTDDGTFNSVWLVPSTTFSERIKPNNKHRRQFVASMKPGTHDQWQKFRYDRAELPGRILAILDDL